MHDARIEDQGRRRLRFLFQDACRSSDVAINATFEDVANALNDLAVSRYGRPIAIDMKLAASEPSTNRTSAPLAQIIWLRIGASLTA